MPGTVDRELSLTFTGCCLRVLTGSEPGTFLCTYPVAHSRTNKPGEHDLLIHTQGRDSATVPC